MAKKLEEMTEQELLVKIVKTERHTRTYELIAAVAQLIKSKTPTLFIHGDKDDFVLFNNLDKVYAACAAPKEKHVIHGAEHAVSQLWFPEEYWRVVDAFLAKYGMDHTPLV